MLRGYTRKISSCPSFRHGFLIDIRRAGHENSNDPSDQVIDKTVPLEKLTRVGMPFTGSALSVQLSHPSDLTQELPEPAETS